MDNLKGKVISGFIWKFFERALSQIISFVVSLVIARILSPDDYGLVAMITVFISIANVFVTTGFGSALIQKKDADETDFNTMFYFSLVFSVILYAILYFCAPLIAKFYKVALLTKLIRVYSLILPLSSYYAIQNAYISKKMDFKKNFWATLSGVIISGAIGIIMALKGFGVWALVVQSIAYTLINTVTLSFIIKWHPGYKVSLKKAGSMFKFGANILGTDLIGTIFTQLNSFLIGKKYTTSDLAYYNRGQSFPYLINTNACTIIASVMFPTLAACEGDKERIKEISRKTCKITTYFLAPMYFGMIAISYNMVLILLKEKWIDCVPYINIICISCILGTFSPTDIQILKSLGRSDLVFKTEFIKKPIWIGATIVALFINTYAITSVLIVATITDIIINSIVVNSQLHYTFLEKLSDWGKTLIPSLLMFAIVFPMNFIPINNIVLMISQIIVGIGFYILYSYMTKNECFNYAKQIIKEKKNER